jgi:hypothetical protein
MPAMNSLMNAKECMDTLVNLYEKQDPSQKRKSKNKLKYLNIEKGELVVVVTGADPGFNAQERTKKTLTTDPFGNTSEADEVSPKVEAGVVT